MPYSTILSAFCGMRIPLEESADRDDARSAAAAQLRYSRRRGLVVAILERGREWEITGPDEQTMVSDNEGVLHIEHRTFRCRECGFAHESRDDAAQCCQPCNDDCD